MQSKTLVIDNFRGSNTMYQFGDINSGRSYVQTVSGQNPFVKPGQLTWNNAPVQIDPDGVVITDLIMAQKERVESGILFVYAIGHTGRVYKIQVNDPNTYNPDYDNAALLTTIVINSPTFTSGGFIDFFGATEKIYLSHDQGLTTLNFDGTGEAFVGILGSWTQDVPKPLKQFVGKLYIGNGPNIAEVDSTETVVSYAKLSPGFPDNTQVRDIDVSPEGTYLEIVVSRLPTEDMTSSTQDTTTTASSDSYIFKWNGTDIGYTAFTTFPSFSLTANTLFQNYQYTFGTDQFGTAVFDPYEKFMTIPEGPSPGPNAVTSTGNMLNFMLPIYFGGVLEADFICWGHQDFEVGNPLGFWDLFFINAIEPETDVVRIPSILPVSNTGLGASSNGYPSNVFGTSKIYFSSLETSDAPSTAYRFYRWNPIVTPDVPASNVLIDAIYQTQVQMFSKKISIDQVRVYGEPWVADNAFEINLIGSSGDPMVGGTFTFTAGSNLTIGDDFAWWVPDTAPTYCIGVSVVNKGSANHVINKIELDYSFAGI